MSDPPRENVSAEPLPPLRSQHTASLPALLDHLNISILITTYQAGKLVILRTDQGVLNTHFRNFSKPMGLAVAGDRLAVGTALEIWEYHNVPAVAQRLEPLGRHDACFVPRTGHVTGDIHIHEMAWGLSGGQGSGVRGQEEEAELWFVNTRFSCLCTLDRIHSFVARWRPSFVTALAAEDRCHLNGLGMVDGQPGLVTALGETDSPGGWRANKKNGGLLMEVPSGKILARGLSMPHSPRSYDGRVWLLESGTGTFGTVDLAARCYQPVVELPGFTRGLDFCGRYAFIGLSQVRESATFSSIPLTERLERRICGVWAVDLVTSQIVGWVEFEEALQEIFAVQVLPGRRFPDLINDDAKLLADSFVLPKESLAAVPEPLRSRS